MSKNRLLIELNSDKLKHTSRAREETEEGGGGYKRERDGEKNWSRSKKNIVYRREIFRVLYYHCSMMKSINLRWLMVVHSVLHRYSTLKTSCHINFPFRSPEKRLKRKKSLPKSWVSGANESKPVFNCSSSFTQSWWKSGIHDKLFW